MSVGCQPGESDVNCVHLSDLELLKCAIGAREAALLYQGKLTPLFKPSDNLRWSHRRLAATHELVKRWLAEEMKREVVFRDPKAVTQYLTTFFAGKDIESFVVMYLDNQHRMILAEEVSRGTIDGASVYPREVVKGALRNNAAAVIFSHNHPSGVAEPSAADRALTERLKAALATVNIRVLDHFVVGGSSATSFAERGWL